MLPLKVPRGAGRRAAASTNPPGGLVPPRPFAPLLLLLTAQPQQLLPTIQSRVIEIALMAPAGARIFTEHELKLLAVLERNAARAAGTLSGALALKADFDSILSELKDDIKKRLEDDFDREKDHYAKTTDGTWLKQREEQVSAQIEADYIQQRSALMDLLLSWFGDVARQQAGNGTAAGVQLGVRATAKGPNAANVIARMNFSMRRPTKQGISA